MGKRVMLLTVILLALSTAVSADWRMYRKDTTVIASVNYISHAPFRGKPSVWVRWHYVKPRNGVGGVKIQFAADCKEQRLFEIAAERYDLKGNYLGAQKWYDAPKEYPLTAGSLNEATYNLLCR